MTFLAPAALFGLALLALPVLVHLFKPRHVRQTPFSSLRWLHLTQQRMARRIQWHQVLLFLLRVALISLLVMAIARPLLFSAGGSGSIERISCIDVSRSMGRKVEGRETPLETARGLAAQHVRAALPGDRTAILLAGAQTAVVAPWTDDAALYLPTLESLTPGSTDANLDAALEVMRTLLAQRRTDAAVEINFYTDRPSGGWTAGKIAEFVRDLPGEPPVSVRVVDVSLPAPRNAWLSSARLREEGEGFVLHVEAAAIGDEPQQRTLNVSGLAGGDVQPLALVLPPGRTTGIDLPLPATFDRAASRVRLWLDPADELPDDDELFVDLGTSSGLQVLVVEPAVPAEPSLRAGFHLRTALAALAENTGSIEAAAAGAQLIVRSPAALTANEIDDADVILLTDVSDLNDAQAGALTRRIRSGAGAAFFLGPGIQTDVYNQRFFQPLNPNEGVLPAALGSVVQATATREGMALWGHWNDRHPLVTGLLDPLLGDLAGVQSRAYYRFTDWSPERAEAVVSFDDGTPAIFARRFGAGRVIVVNASADDRWSDLPRRKSYVALVDRMIGYLQSAGLRRTFTAGEPALLALPGNAAEATYSVLTPAGKTLTPILESAGDRTLLRLDDLTETGFYRVQTSGGESKTKSSSADSANKQASAASGDELTFVVEPSRADSPLRTLDAETLKAWWSPAAIEIVKPSAAGSSTGAGGSRMPLEPWLLAAACLVFLAEMILVHVLCPKLNPAATTSHKHRRGFVPPLRSRQEVAP